MLKAVEPKNTLSRHRASDCDQENTRHLLRTGGFRARYSTLSYGIVRNENDRRVQGAANVKFDCQTLEESLNRCQRVHYDHCSDFRHRRNSAGISAKIYPLQSSIQVVIMHIMQPGDFAGSDSCLERKPVLWLSRADGLEGSMRLFALV